jgi:hypothetical protein
VGDRDKRRGEDSFHLKDPAILRRRLVLDGLSLDMMIVGRERRSEAVRSHGKLTVMICHCCAISKVKLYSQAHWRPTQ